MGKDRRARGADSTVEKRAGPLWVSFYTPDYAECAAQLIVSLQKWRLDHEVLCIPDRGTWVENCAYKPKFIWERMAAHSHRAVIWTDADSEVKEYPFALMAPADVDIRYCRFRRPEGRMETLSGTLYFAPTPGTLRLLDRWIEECALNPGLWDQNCLARALEALPTTIAEPLPVEYVFISDTFRALFPGKLPVVEHYQYSRVTRGKTVSS